MSDTYKVIQADRDAAEAEKLGKRYREIQAGEFACSEIVCTFPHDGNCWCFNTALAKHREDTEALIVGWLRTDAKRLCDDPTTEINLECGLAIAESRRRYRSRRSSHEQHPW